MRTLKNGSPPPPHRNVNVTLSRREVHLRAIPSESPAVAVSSLVSAMFSATPPRQDLYRTRYGRALNLDTIENSLRQADCGSMRALTDLSRETIDTDPHLAAVLNKRFNSVSSLPWEVVPADGDGIDVNKARFYAGVVRNQLKQLPDFSQRLNQLAWGLFDGRAGLENQWAFVPSIPGLPKIADPQFGTVNWMIKDIGWIHPRRLHYGPQRELRIYDDQGAGDFSARGIALRDYPSKFIYWTPQLFGDYPEREGLARRCLYWSFFKRFSARERMILLELFGKPWRWIEVDEKSTADADDLKRADDMLQNIGGNTSFRLPRGTKMSLTQPGQGAGQVHQEQIEESDKQISKLVLGQTGTTDAQPSGLNNIQANVMQDEQFMITASDARMISDTIETLLSDQIIALNFGAEELAHAPHFRLRADVPLDRGKELDRLLKAVNSGLEISVAEAYEVAGFRRPKSDEPVIKIETPPVHPMAVQPSPERPVIAYPDKTELPPRKLQPIAPEGEGGLESPRVRPIDQPGGGLIPVENVAEVVAQMPSARGAHPSDLLLAQVILSHGGGCKCVGCGSRVLLDGDADEPVTQPEEAVIGSIETLIGKGVKEGARELAAIAEQYAVATEGLEDAAKIRQALERVHEDIELFAFSRSLERRILHGAMSGAVAGNYEFQTDSTLSVAALERVRLAEGDEDNEPAVDPQFVTRTLQDAVRWFKATNVVSKSVFNRLDVAAKRRAFTIAGVTNDLVLQKAKDELESLIRTGGQLRNFRAAVSQRFENAGFTPVNASHVETIYRTNVLNAYNSGRYAQATQPAVLRVRPYWQIRTVNDGPPRQRATHQAVHMWVLNASDSFWKSAYPPFGFNCRCRVVSMSKVEVEARGLQIRVGGEVHGLPDPGFASGFATLL
jgi:phage gp29-like protein